MPSSPGTRAKEVCTSLCHVEVVCSQFTLSHFLVKEKAPPSPRLVKWTGIALSQGSHIAPVPFHLANQVLHAACHIWHAQCCSYEFKWADDWSSHSLAPESCRVWCFTFDYFVIMTWHKWQIFLPFSYSSLLAWIRTSLIKSTKTELTCPHCCSNLNHSTLSKDIFWYANDNMRVCHLPRTVLTIWNIFSHAVSSPQLSAPTSIPNYFNEASFAPGLDHMNFTAKLAALWGTPSLSHRYPHQEGARSCHLLHCWLSLRRMLLGALEVCWKIISDEVLGQPMLPFFLHNMLMQGGVCASSWNGQRYGGSNTSRYGIEIHGLSLHAFVEIIVLLFQLTRNNPTHMLPSPQEPWLKMPTTVATNGEAFVAPRKIAFFFFIFIPGSPSFILFHYTSSLFFPQKWRCTWHWDVSGSFWRPSTNFWFGFLSQWGGLNQKNALCTVILLPPYHTLQNDVMGEVQVFSKRYNACMCSEAEIAGLIMWLKVVMTSTIASSPQDKTKSLSLRCTKTISCTLLWQYYFLSVKLEYFLVLHALWRRSSRKKWASGGLEGLHVFYISDDST